MQSSNFLNLSSNLLCHGYKADIWKSKPEDDIKKLITGNLLYNLENIL